MKIVSLFTAVLLGITGCAPPLPNGGGGPTGIPSDAPSASC